MKDEVLAMLVSLDDRVRAIESDIKGINLSLGGLAKPLSNGNRTTMMVIKFIAFPLIFIVGALVGVKLYL